jgi:hypothetical protein
MDSVNLQIRDNGRGFDPAHIPSGHYGLSMMRERAKAIGACYRCPASRTGHRNCVHPLGSDGAEEASMMPLTPIRVMLVDDHTMVRRGLATFLKVFDDLELVGEAADGEAAMQLCARFCPT